MSNNSTKSVALQSEAGTAVHLLDDWFDPIEAGLRDFRLSPTGCARSGPCHGWGAPAASRTGPLPKSERGPQAGVNPAGKRERPPGSSPHHAPGGLTMRAIIINSED